MSLFPKLFDRFSSFSIGLMYNQHVQVSKELNKKCKKKQNKKKKQKKKKKKTKKKKKKKKKN